MFYDYPSIYDRFAQGQTLLNDIVKAINGEHSAIVCYEQIARMAPVAQVRDRILEIRKDEIRHFQTFSQMYFRLTGRQHVPQITGVCPSDYEAALRHAFKDEQETVDFYHEVADRSDDRAIEQAFRHAAADEQNHAVWFLYFLTQR